MPAVDAKFNPQKAYSIITEDGTKALTAAKCTEKC